MKLLGFRSNKIWKKVISIAYLFFWGLIFLVIMTDGKYPNLETKDFVINKISDLVIFLFFLSPYIYLSDTKIREKLPLLRKRKLWATLLFFILLFIITVFLNSAILDLHTTEYLADMENHAYVETSSTEATCEKDGVLEKTCEYCGRKKSEILSAKGHTMQVVFDDENKTIENCQICGYKKTINKSTEKPSNTKDNSEEKLVFELTAGTKGKYGKTIVYNEGTDGEITRCIYHIPAGTYKITNIGEHISQVNIYSDETHKTQEGWEEPAKTYGCELLDVNKSTIISIKDGRNIYIPEPSKIRFEQQ